MGEIALDCKAYYHLPYGLSTPPSHSGVRQSFGSPNRWEDLKRALPMGE